MESIPSKILARYTENFRYILKQVQKLLDQQTDSHISSIKDSLSDSFGFKKTLLMLTNVGNLISLSTTDGEILWKHYFSDQTPSSIFVRNMPQRD